MRGTGSLSDAELVGRCRAGDESAWSELVRRYCRYVHAILLQAYRLPPHDAEDVFQDVFSRAYDRLGSLRDDSAFRPWLAQIARHAAIDRIRTSSREVLVREPPEEVVDDMLERLDEAIAVRQAVETLPEHCSEILDRFFTRDESYRTIGRELDIPPGTIASRISRCLDRLREELGVFAGTGRK